MNIVLHIITSNLIFQNITIFEIIENFENLNQFEILENRIILFHYSFVLSTFYILVFESKLDNQFVNL